jgi:hypothetical protein
VRRIVLHHRCQPGDLTVMTAAVRDLQLAHPGCFEVAVETPSPALWENNPYIVPHTGEPMETMKLTYGPYMRLARSGKHSHFIRSFHQDLEAKLQIPVPLTEPRPDLHLSPAENQPLVAGPYWLIVAGGKADFSTKIWAAGAWQELVDLMTAAGLPIVRAGAVGTGAKQHDQHLQPNLVGGLNLVGQTNLREFLRLVKFAQGIVCSISLPMHLAAAFERPCVVLGGGREEWFWEAYHQDNHGLGQAASRVRVSHRYLHTIGLLDCCKDKGCWKSKVTRAERDHDKAYCYQPHTRTDGQIVPLCMEMISPAKVFEAILSYYLDGTLVWPEGTVIPNINDLTRLTLPDGRKATCQVQVEQVIQPVVDRPREPFENLPKITLVEQPKGNKAVLPQDQPKPRPPTSGTVPPRRPQRPALPLQTVVVPHKMTAPKS